MVPVNFTAIFLAAIAALIIGFLWHGPLFCKTWMRLTEKQMPTGDDMVKAKAMMPKQLVFNFLTNLVMAFVLAHAFYFANKAGVPGKNVYTLALGVTFWNWLGFVVCSSASQVIWEGRKLNLWLFNMAYYFVSLFAMSLIIAVM